jgi:hypothetical protein
MGRGGGGGGDDGWKELGQKFSTNHCSNCTEDACIFLPTILTFNYIVSTQNRSLSDRWIPKGAE